jgi:23S rRNA (uracil1939-C5)-methyltransferase
MMPVGDEIALVIEKPAVGGRMIARLEGRVVLVAGAIPGEQVTARVERVGRGVVYANTVTVECPSPHRRDVAADPFCGGCLYAHVTYDHQLDLKRAVIADAFKRIGRVDPPEVGVMPSPEHGYRMRARLHVRGGRLGFFREGTHEICGARQTGQLLPETFDVLDRVGALLASGEFRAVQALELAENAAASERVVALDAAAPLDRAALARVASDEGLSGVVAGADVVGSPYVNDRVAIEARAHATLRRHVRSFFQGNRFLLDDFTDAVVRQVPAGSRVVDLYAGGGLFSVSASLGRQASVTAVEGDRHAVEDLRQNAALSGAAIAAVHEPVESFVKTARRLGRPDVVIADPPRAGMSRPALEGVIDLAAPRLVYVSCDVATLARDARCLIERGYEIVRADAFDLFPNTPHVETVIVFGFNGPRAPKIPAPQAGREAPRSRPPA